MSLRYFLTAFAVCFVFLGLAMGIAGFWVAFSVGMQSFGPHQASGWLKVLGILVQLPIPVLSPVVAVVNSVFWAAVLSLILAAILAHRDGISRRM